MLNSTLFPHSEASLTPAANRREPAFWIRRLVILPDTTEIDTPIRDIEFRRGLNIVQTAPRTETDSDVVGHSVGKTLLTRLIRYSLGEHTFAIKSERSRVLSKLPQGCIVAHWRVGEADWCVFRPLDSLRKHDAFAVRGNSWQNAISGTAERLAFSEFTDALNATAFACLHELTNSPLYDNRWLKTLAFLTRDWQCGYRHFNDWRDSDSESGISIERREASQFVRWLLDLIDLEELPLWENHQSLLQRQKELKGERDAGRQFLAATDPTLRDKLDVEDIGDGLFATALSERVGMKIRQLRGLRDDAAADFRIDALEAEEAALYDDFTEATEQLGKQEGHLQLLEEQLETRQLSRDGSLYANVSPFESCSMATCPMKVVNRDAPQPDPAHEDITELLRDDIQKRRNAISSQAADRELKKTELNDLRRRLRDERQRQATEVAGIERTIGRWEAYRDDVQRRQLVSEKVLRYEALLKSLAASITESLKDQEEERKRQRRRLKLMSDQFSMVLREIFGASGDGEFQISANGLEPVVSAQLSPGGAALSAMAEVLSFDLACLTSSIAGLGHHPRFIVHDSPRSNDIEESLFHQMFRAVHDWEAHFAPDEVSFQYIITTTTPPPDELASSDREFVRLTLSARKDEDRLLRFRY